MNSGKEQQTRSLFVGSLAKGFQVLEAFESGRRELGITDIARITGLEKSAASRIVQTMFKLGYLSQNPANRRYSLSAKMLTGAFNFLNANPVIEVAMPRLVGLSDAIGRSVALCILSDIEVIYAVRLERREFYYPTGHIGERQPVYCTSGGRAILSALPRETARDLLERSDRRKLTPHTKTDLDELMDELKKVSRQSYCIQVEEYISNEINFSAPVINGEAEPVAAVVVSQLFRKKDVAELEAELAPLLLQTVNEISIALGAPRKALQSLIPNN